MGFGQTRKTIQSLTRTLLNSSSYTRFDNNPNPFHNCSFSKFSNSKALKVNQLGFECSEKAFSHCIVPTIPFSVHTTGDPRCLQCGLLTTANMLTASVRVL